MGKRIELPEPGDKVGAIYLAAILNVGIATIHRYTAQGILPPPVSRKPTLLWRTEDIQAWVKTRVPGKWRYALEESPQ